MSQYEKKGLTPHQGDDRVFGEFECKKCDHKWKSGNSWADMGQQCIFCKTNIYPDDQYPLSGGGKDGDKPHLSSHCEKCKVLGYLCKLKKDDVANNEVVDKPVEGIWVPSCIRKRKSSVRK